MQMCSITLIRRESIRILNSTMMTQKSQGIGVMLIIL